MKTELINVTPAMAENWLDTANKSNRQLRLSLARKYAKDMEEGRWDVTHQGIAFYDDGSLADGQHRLMAITVANRPVKMMVTQGLPRSTAQAIDQNAPREMFDVIRIAGGPEWATRDAVAIARKVLVGMDSNARLMPTAHEVSNFLNKHSEQLQFTASLTPRRRRYLTTTALSACYFCAVAAGEEREKVARFAEIMWSGEISGPSENAAIRLREYLLNNPHAWNGNVRPETCRRAQKAIKIFCMGEPLTRLYAPDTLSYPTPK